MFWSIQTNRQTYRLGSNFCCFYLKELRVLVGSRSAESRSLASWFQQLQHVVACSSSLSQRTRLPNRDGDRERRVINHPTQQRSLTKFKHVGKTLPSPPPGGARELPPLLQRARTIAVSKRHQFAKETLRGLRTGNWDRAPLLPQKLLCESKRKHSSPLSSANCKRECQGLFFLFFFYFFFLSYSAGLLCIG